MDKKNILFAIHYLELGGAERSLIGLLGALDYSRVDVDLFVYAHRGELMKDIPPQVQLLPEIPEYAQIERPMKDVLKDGYWRIVLARLKAKRQFKRYVKRNHPKERSAVFSYVMKNVMTCLPSIMPNKEYDMAVSFLTPHDVVRDKVRARKKTAWIHTDYSWIDVDSALELPVWNAYNHIVAVSERVSDAFVDVFPSLKQKTMVIENILSPRFVQTRAEAIAMDVVELEMPNREGIVNLLSIGRFSEQKNFDNVPDICRRILERGISVMWYLIGFGGDEAFIRQKIAEAGMEGHVILLGKKENPYPYIKACDVYVQPSRYEGKAVTVREAQMLCKPVVVTNYPTADSQIADGVDGVIVPLNNEDCASALADFIADTERRTLLESNLRTRDYGNEAEAEKFMALL